ncbi:MAG: hypothetical protein ACM3Q1_15285 [Bacteroidales bacterium]
MIEDQAARPPRKGDTALRLLVLGSLYALAIFFVVAMSPSMGFVTSHPVGEVGRVAAAPEPANR